MLYNFIPEMDCKKIKMFVQEHCFGGESTCQDRVMVFLLPTAHASYLPAILHKET